jgi:hypothetical protein
MAPLVVEKAVRAAIRSKDKAAIVTVDRATHCENVSVRLFFLLWRLL